MKSIVIVNPVGYIGFGYATMIRKFFKEYVVIGLWTTQHERDRAVNGAMHLIDMHFVIDDSYDNIVTTLEQFEPTCFLVGNDSAYEIADKLQGRFFPEHCNDPDKLRYRTDKPAYLAYLAEQGAVDSESFIIDASTVEQCAHGDWLITSLSEKADRFIKPNSELTESLLASDETYMAQTYFEGVEYCIEMCTYRGVHRCTMSSRYHGEYLVNNFNQCYESNDLVSPDDPNVKIIYDYVASILETLGVKLGLTWTRVTIKDGVPHLVDIRFTAQDWATIGPIHNATGTNWARESLLAYLNRYTVQPLFYRKLGDFSKIFVNNYTEKRIDRMYWARVDQLPGVAYCEKRNVYGKHCPVTSGVNNVLGVIMLQNNDSTMYQLTQGAIISWKKSICE